MVKLQILGRSINLLHRSKQQLKGISIGDSLSYNFYDGEYAGVPLLLLEPKNVNPTPRDCAITSNRLFDLFGLPVVFILKSAPSYERQRLIDKNVFFVMGEKFACLPTLIANERIRKTKPAKRLTPVAQYILLYHLQVETLEGLSAREMTNKLPYSYESITLGITCLEDLQLCEKIVKDSRTKIIHFVAKGRDLWEKAQSGLINPVDKRIYCDGMDSSKQYCKCSINALAHYGRLNPDPFQMIMMSKKEFKSLEDANLLRNINEFDGNVMIEIWKYPVVSNCEQEWVDKLSLVLTLKKDDDARVENEIEQIINELEWKD